MGAGQQRLTPEERSNLVAYLDRELNEADARVIEAKLTQSATARREADVLAKTWELLDVLPRPRAADDFTERTLTEARRLTLPEDRIVGAAARSLRRAARLGLWAIASAVLFLAGMAFTAWVWPDPTARLARDLSIAESLDEYREAGTIEFLDGLDRLPGFDAAPE